MIGSRVRPLALALATILAAGAGLATNFRFERTVTPAATGANRLDPDAALLGGAAALRYDVTHAPAALAGDDDRRFALAGGLDDLRIFDAGGREVPYLLIAPPTEEPHWVRASILPIAPTKVTSGFEADLGGVWAVDRIRIEGIAPPFLKRLKLEGGGDRTHWTLLAAEGTLFDVPDQQLRNLEVAFDRGEYRYLRVTWDDRASAHIAGVQRVLARLSGTAAAPVSTRLSVALQPRPSEPGLSRYRIRLPGAHLPVIAIEVDVANGNVFRDARIHEARLLNGEVVPALLGSAQLRRAEREGGVASQLAIPTTFPEGPDLELTIDDGNNAPLAIRGVRAILAPLPWIYFESADGGALTARYGAAKLTAAQYDLEASRGPATTAKTEIARWQTPAKITPGAPEFSDATSLLGAAVDAKKFRSSRPLGDAPRGLTSLLLDPDVLINSPSLADVRLVDSSGKQVPYLIEHRDEPIRIDLTIPARKQDPQDAATSIYALTFPYGSLPAGAKLVLTTSAHVFDRNVTLRTAADTRTGRQPSVIGTATWRSTETDLPAPALIFEPVQGHGVEIAINEGDNAPLPLTTARVLLPSYALRFYHPGTALTLVYGNTEASAPRYDLALLAPRLFGESAREISLAAATPAEKSDGGSAMETRLFWGGLVAAVLVLLALLARVLKR
ncbi:MAG TPA: DUF3999 family protein [Thermoanaerobaculia bacterium]|nr:DUF3999 family protein [Thermoanaerobaculia bacterium]